VFEQHGHGRFGLVRKLPGDEFEQHHPQRIHIAAPIQRQPVGLLRRHIRRRADDHAAGQLAAQHAGDAEVAQVGVAVFIQHDVAGLQIAVDDALLVRVIQRQRHLTQRLFQLIHLGLAAPDELLQAAPGQIAHDDIGQALVLAVIVDGQDVGMFQVGDDIHLALETFVKAGVVQQMTRQHFDGNRAVHRLLAGAVHRRHAAPPDLVEDFVLSQLFADQFVAGDVFAVFAVFAHNRAALRPGVIACLRGHYPTPRAGMQAKGNHKRAGNQNGRPGESRPQVYLYASVQRFDQKLEARHG
jgi:hypothetical protein